MGRFSLWTQCIVKKKTVEGVLASCNDLIVQVKGNQPSLLALASSITEKKPVGPTYNTFEKNHGRMELRNVTVFDVEENELGDEWNGLFKSVAEVFRQTTWQNRSGHWQQRQETSIYLSTAKISTKEFATAIRGHWGIENRVHYVRDVSMKEDASRIRTKPGIFARIRSVCLNVMRSNNVKNISQAIFENALDLKKVLEMEGLK